jgi:hypothetical protein
MVSSRIEGPIVYFNIEGVFSADDLYNETIKWLESGEEYVGYLVDITKMTKHPAIEQRKAEAYAKKLQTNKVRAIVAKDEATARLINIYMRFTKASQDDVKYFSKEEDAKAWLLSLV